MINLKENVKVIKEDQNYLVVYKPSYLPTVPLKKDVGENTLLKIVSEYYPDIISFTGYSSWENGVMHRLDTFTSGIVLIARNKESFDFFLAFQKSGMFIKEYRAFSNKNSTKIDVYGNYPYEDPYLSNEAVNIKSYFRYYGKGRKMVLPVLDSYSEHLIKKSTGVVYNTNVKFSSYENDNYIFNCKLTSGFKHQVRTHMAWSGYPLIGDECYGGIKSKKFGLEAVGITFPDPKNNKEITIKHIEE